MVERLNISAVIGVRAAVPAGSDVVRKCSAGG